MKEEKDDLEQLLFQLKDEWNEVEPPLGHQKRFLKKIEKKTKTRYWIPLSVAASIVLFIGLFVTLNKATTAKQEIWTNVSPQTQETHEYFTAIINTELSKIKNNDSPESKQLVDDAMKQMQKLDTDYDKIKKELKENGENKQLVHAMITNLQTRVTFLEEVLLRIEMTNKIKEKQHENKTL
ncbi:anti-sigma factor [Flavobacterium sp. '19STA2R22 D10 B1']|uniref:anti-sigma factor n=1 Tax=Flavobacterium aerium TaxID=3037261 RepID=UPI00278C62AA|nr:anti-sigma factor [Flavobacterium sp. '19STA2R22 D10 B1']